MKAAKDAALVKRSIALSRENPRYGYRRVWALLRREGWKVNKKRLQRLWREADLKVPNKENVNDAEWEPLRIAARGDVPSTSTTSAPTTSRWTPQKTAGG